MYDLLGPKAYVGVKSWEGTKSAGSSTDLVKIYMNRTHINGRNETQSKNYPYQKPSLAQEFAQAWCSKKIKLYNTIHCKALLATYKINELN